MAGRQHTQDTEVEAHIQRGRPWLYPYNRRLRHLHGISIRNLALSQAHALRPRGNTVDDDALPTSLRSPAKVLAQQERKGLALEHSRSITDLKAIAESTDKGSLAPTSHPKPTTPSRNNKAGTRENQHNNEALSSSSPGKRPAMRRLRRRSTLDWQNGGSEYRQKKLEDVIGANMADVFFSLHAPPRQHHDSGAGAQEDDDARNEPVYVSEVIEQTMNPDFRFFDLNESGGPRISRLEDLTVKVWARNTAGASQNYQFLVEMTVNLRALQFIGKTIEGFPQPLPQNCILFHMKDGIYTTFLDNFTGMPTPLAPPPQRSMSSTQQVLPTASYDALMRLGTLDECVQDALATRIRLEKEINQILEGNAEAVRKIGEVGSAREALTDVRDAVGREGRSLAAAKRRRDELRARLQQRREHIASGYASIRDGEADIKSITQEIQEAKDKLATAKEETRGQRRRICEDLQRIFPLAPLPNKTLHFSIAGLPLANSLFASDDDTESTAAALGHVALVLHNLQFYLSTPLPYPLTPRGSSSTILDPISEVAGGSGKDSRVYPLFGGRGPRFRFEFAVFLLNKDVECLSERVGLKVLDLRQTLPNLTYLLFVATAGEGEVPGRRVGGIRGFLREGKASGSGGSSRAGSVDEGVGKGLMLPPPGIPLPKKGGLNGNGKLIDGGPVGNGRLKLGYGQVAAGRGSKLRDVA